MEEMTIEGHSELIIKSGNLWGFRTNDGKLITDSHFSAGIVVAMDEIASYNNKPNITDGRNVRITIELL